MQKIEKILITCQVGGPRACGLGLRYANQGGGGGRLQGGRDFERFWEDPEYFVESSQPSDLDPKPSTLNPKPRVVCRELPAK